MLPVDSPEQSGSEERNAGNGLVPADPMAGRTPRLALTGAMIQLPVKLDVGVPIRDFRVRDLIALRRGAVVETQWIPGEDVPVVSGDQQLAWSEFEVVDSQLAVRLTRLA